MSRDSDNPMVRDDLWPRDENTRTIHKLCDCEACGEYIWSGQTFYAGDKGGHICERCVYKRQEANRCVGW